jgi:hypothetical protein
MTGRAPALPNLTATQLGLVNHMARAMAEGEVEIVRSDSTDIVDEPFADTFANFLLLHHAIYGGALNKESFEYVFTVANEASGRKATRNRLRGSNTHDLTVDGVRWSLKTEAGSTTSPNRLYIAKWMEARFIRECTNPAECAAAMRRIVDHMDGYERIIALQAIMNKERTRTLYRLVEVPREQVVRLGTLSHEHFQKPGSRRSYGANLPRSGVDDVVTKAEDRVLRVLLDSSAEKVRMWFEADACKVHASWALDHAPEPQSDDD